MAFSSTPIHLRSSPSRLYITDIQSISSNHDASEDCVTEDMDVLGASLHRLNDDVLLVLIHILHTHLFCALMSLSWTCKRLRALSASALFSRSHTKLRTPDERAWMVPPTLFSLVRQARYFAFGDEPQWATNPWLCGVLDPPPFFTDSLERMPRWSSITIQQYAFSKHGVPWGTLQTVLSAPALRKLTVYKFLFAPRKLVPSEMFILANVSPLTSFTYIFGTLHTFDDPPAPTEIEALSSFLEAVCGTLETLELTAGSGPLDILERSQWPRLHTLKLSGRNRQPQLRSYASLFATMPRLRVLALELHVKGPPVGLSVPPVSSSSFPWPELEHLFLPIPLPEDDEMYSQLPLSLQTLSLLSYPHFAQRHQYHVKTWDIKPPRPAFRVLQSILQRCLASTHLTRLEIEYAVERRPREDLLRFVVDTCPHLQELKLLRYRPDFLPDEPRYNRGSYRTWKSPQSLRYVLLRVRPFLCAELSVQTDIAHQLAPLTRLRMLWVNLDYASTPGFNPYHVPPVYDKFCITTLPSVALVFAQIMPPALQSVGIWVPSEFLKARCRWAVYRVERRVDGLPVGVREDGYEFAEIEELCYPVC
ncbi:uncharacterized protein BXZ73DRAFT_97861 [Epithele typhae]|uniref:uncharacterized protein n=1 Tax=Epithele typhae TaxID=378194 RepID=UPI0020080072|nr:uncharacterized protein BXZ73DRAFT_97861 [Epithele typhae]KAH9942452.1 hypothetical protein BXZ73DRAFT_97861 [Epithele typhae]